MKNACRKQGQTMSELIIIIAILAIGSILIIGLFGKQIKNTFTRLGSGLGGKELGASQAMQTAGKMNSASKSSGMDNFDNKVSGGL
jgi:hypothetical protein